MKKLLLSTLKVVVIFTASGLMAYMVLRAQVTKAAKVRNDKLNSEEVEERVEDITYPTLTTVGSSKSDTIDTNPILTTVSAEELGMTFQSTKAPALAEDTSEEYPLEALYLEKEQRRRAYEASFESSKAAPFDLSEIVVSPNGSEPSKENGGKAKEKPKKEFFHSSKVLVATPLDDDELPSPKKGEKYIKLEEDTLDENGKEIKKASEKEFFHSSKAPLTVVVLENIGDVESKEEIVKYYEKLKERYRELESKLEETKLELENLKKKLDK